MSLTLTPAFPVTNFANRIWPYYLIAGNAILPTQGAFWSRHAALWNAGSGGTNGVTIGMGTGVGAGTFVYATPTTTNFYTNMARGTYASVVTTANQQVGVTQADAQWFRSASAGQGGFFFACRFGFETWTAGDRLFIGLAAAINALTTGQPSAVVNMVGFGIDASDTAITFMHNDGSGTAVKDTIAGQPALASNQGYAGFIYSKPNDSVVYYRLDDLNAGTTVIDTNASSDLPATGTMLKLGAVMGNAANTVAGNAKLGLAFFYIESDY